MDARRGNGALRTGRLLVAFVAAALVVGALGAGLAAPPLAAVGALASAGVTDFTSLPSVLTTAAPEQRSQILAADGSLIVAPGDEDRVVVPLAAVAPVMRQAQVAIEDSRFYEHGPVDVQGLVRAAVSDLRTGTAGEGASTLTQQLVKLTLQSQALAAGHDAAAAAAVEKTLPRKLTELRYAAALERAWSKDRILESYLNLAYYGAGAYGVEAAALRYFGVHASALTLTEAATLAGLVQSPSTTDPVSHPAAAKARRDVVLGRMLALRLVSRAQWQAAVRRPLAADLHVTHEPTTCASSAHPYFCSFVVSWLEQEPELGPTRRARRDLLYRGGLTVRTTLDPAAERDVDRALQAVAPRGNALGVAAAAYVTRPGTGDVVALGQDTAYGSGSSAGTTELDYAVDARYGGSRGFQFGSTAKAFSLVTAMEQGLGTGASVDAPAADSTHPATFRPKDFPQPCGLSRPWRVYNDEAWHGGRMPLTTATEQSTNTAFVALAGRIGVCAIRSTMTAFGVHDASGGPIGTYPPQVVLGAQQVSPQTMADAYAALATGGVLCRTRPVTSVTRAGHTLLAVAPSCTRVGDAHAVRQTTQLLEDNMTHGSGILNQLSGRPSAGKTGTSNANAQSWFVGYTPQLATAVWVGNPTQQNRPMFDVSMAGKTCASMTGACYAAPIWRRIMDAVSSGLPVEPMP